MVDAPALYVGRLRHRRFRPRPHEFSYPIFMALLDVDRIDAAMRASHFTALNRFNWAAFYDADHLGNPSRALRERVADDARVHGHDVPSGPIYLLTHLRYLGYNFNPISFFYCCDENGDVSLVMGEVHNTFGERCTYWLPKPANGAFRHRTPKVMHVSPFMTMDVDYEFVVTPPGASLVAHMNTIEQADGTDRPYFDATLTLERRDWTSASIRRALIRQPMMTASVIAAIHWEALKLWWKGVPFHPHPGGSSVRSHPGREVEI